MGLQFEVWPPEATRQFLEITRSIQRHHGFGDDGWEEFRLHLADLVGILGAAISPGDRLEFVDHILGLVDIGPESRLDESLELIGEVGSDSELQHRAPARPLEDGASASESAWDERLTVSIAVAERLLKDGNEANAIEVWETILAFLLGLRDARSRGCSWQELARYQDEFAASQQARTDSPSQVQASRGPDPAFDYGSGGLVSHVRISWYSLLGYVRGRYFSDIN